MSDDLETVTPAPDCEAEHLRIGPGQEYVIYDPMRDRMIAVPIDRDALLLSHSRGVVSHIDDFAPPAWLLDGMATDLQRKVWATRFRYWADILDAEPSVADEPAVP